jgi:hypothetical protein
VPLISGGAPDIASLAFRLKMRTDALEARSTSDLNVYAKKVELAHDIAQVLRKNVVQAHKSTKIDEEVWRTYPLFLSNTT